MYNKLNKSAKFNREKISGGKISELFSVKKEYWLVRDSQNYENNYKPDINSARIHYVKNIAKIEVFTSDEINSDLDRTSQIINSNVNLTRNFLKETRYGYIDFSHLKDLPLIDENEELIEYLLTENDYSGAAEKDNIDSRGETFWKIQIGRTFQDASKIVYAEITINKVRDDAPVNIRENFFYGEPVNFSSPGKALMYIYHTVNNFTPRINNETTAIYSKLEFSGYKMFGNERISSFLNLIPRFIFEGLSILWAHPISNKIGGECNLLSEWGFKAFHDFDNDNYRTISLPQTPGVKQDRGLRTGDDYNSTWDAFRLITENYAGNNNDTTATTCRVLERWFSNHLMNGILNSRGLLFIENPDISLLTTHGFSSPYILENHKENELQILRKVKYQSMVRSLGDSLPGPFGAVTNLVGGAISGITSLFGNNQSGTSQETGISDYDIKDGESNLFYWISPIKTTDNNNYEMLRFFDYIQKVKWGENEDEDNFKDLGLLNKNIISQYTKKENDILPYITIQEDDLDSTGFEIKTILIGGLFYEKNLSILSPREGDVDDLDFSYRYNENIFFHTEEDNFTQTQIIL